MKARFLGSHRRRAARLGAASVAVIALVSCLAAVANAAAHARRGSVRSYLQQKGEEKGFVLSGGSQTAKGVTAWVNAFDTNSAGTNDAKRWKSERLIAGAVEQTVASDGSHDGVSWVEEFATAAGAKAESAYTVSANLKTKDEVRFRVPHIADAVGVEYPIKQGAKAVAAANILFVEGRCTVLIGNGDGTAADTVSVADLTAAAQHIYTRTYGRCPL